MTRLWTSHLNGRRRKGGGPEPRVVREELEKAGGKKGAEGDNEAGGRAMSEGERRKEEVRLGEVKEGRSGRGEVRVAKVRLARLVGPEDRGGKARLI